MRNLALLCGLFLIVSCSVSEIARIQIILDTDSNKELDDQHALAYLFYNPDVFDIKGITINATYNGGSIEGHYNEARRVMQLCDVWGKYSLIKGANKNFEAIVTEINSEIFVGYKAVEFIIKKALGQENS